MSAPSSGVTQTCQGGMMSVIGAVRLGAPTLIGHAQVSNVVITACACYLECLAAGDSACAREIGTLASVATWNHFHAALVSAMPSHVVAPCVPTMVVTTVAAMPSATVVGL